MKTKKLTLAVIVCIAVAFTSCSISVKDNPKDSSKKEEQTTSQEPENQTPSPEPDPAPTPTPVLSPEEIPLTLEAIDAGTITITNPSEFTNLKYSLNDGEKILVQTTQSTVTIQYNAKDIICFFADGPANEDSQYLNIKCSADCYIYGNIMSLIEPDNYKNATDLKKKGCFISLFKSNSHIKNHSSKELVLPATTLTNSCYVSMFQECYGLTKAPALPATILSNSCYSRMFENCTNISKAPELPATTLTENCYYGMFSCCSGLTTAPNLPATTLAPNCYWEMFIFCTSLSSVPQLPAEILEDRCYESMFNGCSSLKTAPALPAETIADSCYLSMFACCSSLTTAPQLPAKNLAPCCYSSMFQGCTGLTTAPQLPATTLANDCYEFMFAGCSNLEIAPNLPATSLAEKCYYGMFSGCTKLTKAPILSASSLEFYCYDSMFDGCTNLNSVICLATENINFYSTQNWLQGVASTGTFIKSPDMNEWVTNSSSGIPTGWTVYDFNPLTLEAIEDGTIIISNPEKADNLRYRKNDGSWNYAVPIENKTIIEISTGDKVFFLADGITFSTSNLLNINCSADCYIYGNVMCLIDSKEFSTKIEISKKHTFDALFKDNAHILNHPNKQIYLPATTLAYSCYRRMFQNCTKLTSPPTLPATSLKGYCYSAMFKGCSSLNTAPDLPATKLISSCYEEMFSGCSNLNYIKCLAYEIPYDCTTNWLQGVSETGTFVKHNRADWSARTDNDGIPADWTIQNAYEEY